MQILNNYQVSLLNPIALRTAKTLWNFGRSEGNRVKLFAGISISTLIALHL